MLKSEIKKMLEKEMLKNKQLETRLECGREYLMIVRQSEITPADALEAFGFWRSGYEKD